MNTMTELFTAYLEQSLIKHMETRRSIDWLESGAWTTYKKREITSRALSRVVLKPMSIAKKSMVSGEMMSRYKP